MSFQKELLLALAASVLFGCDTIEQHFSDSCIHVNVVNDKSEYGSYKVVTKGSIVTTSNLGSAEGFGTFGMEGFILDDVSGINPKVETHYVNGGVCSKSGDSWILTDGSVNEYNWISGMDFAFWSYAPRSLFASSSFNKDGYSLTGYTIPATVTSQQDLIVAYTPMNSGSGQSPVDISFKHALAAVRFKTNFIDCSLKSVSISNVYVKGDLSIGVNNKDVNFLWENLSSSTTTFTQNFSSVDFDGDGLQDKSGNKIFFMIPQKSTSGHKAKLNITVENTSHETVTVTKEIDIDWEAGKIYTYILSYDSETQDVNIQVRGQKFESLDLDGIQWCTDF